MQQAGREAAVRAAAAGGDHAIQSWIGLCWPSCDSIVPTVAYYGVSTKRQGASGLQRIIDHRSAGFSQRAALRANAQSGAMADKTRLHAAL